MRTVAQIIDFGGVEMELLRECGHAAPRSHTDMQTNLEEQDALANRELQPSIHVAPTFRPHQPESSLCMKSDTTIHSFAFVETRACHGFCLWRVLSRGKTW